MPLLPFLAKLVIGSAPGATVVCHSVRQNINVLFLSRSIIKMLTIVAWISHKKPNCKLPPSDENMILWQMNAGWMSTN